MKQIGTTLMLILILTSGFGQGITEGKDNGATADTISNTNLIVGDSVLVVRDSPDTFSISIGNRQLNILESLEGKKQYKLEKKEKINKVDDDNEGIWDYYQGDGNDDDDNDRPRRHFKGHWAGIEAGFNNYTNSRNDIVIPDDIDYMTLHSGKSNNFNLNFSQLSLGVTKHFGIVTGLGLNWNNYRFDGNNNIIKGNDGIIEIYDPGSELKKSKFSTLYLTIPALIELQMHADGDHVVFSGGVIGAVKLTSHSKMIYKEGDKVKSDDDFSLNLLRYGATARVGYENFMLYGTYYLTPLFKTGKGPGGYDLFPFEIGCAFTFND